MASSLEPADTVPPLSETAYWQTRSAANYAAFWDYTARSMGTYRARWDDVWAADMLAPVPVANAATLLQPLESAQVGDLVARVGQFFAARPGAPWTLRSAWPSPDLQVWDFQLLIGGSKLMVRLPGGTLPPVPAALHIVEVSTAAALADLERVFIDGYPIPALQPVRRGSVYDARALGGDLHFWVGYVAERPVAAAMSLPDAHVNGIYTVATLPDVRGRGYGTALTAQALAAAPALPAVLEATAMGYPIYQRLGFVQVARYEVWLKPR